MLYPAHSIKIIITGSDDDLDACLQYLYSFSYNYLKVQNTFPEITWERSSETLDAFIYSRNEIALCVFDTLATRFHQLIFKIYARRHAYSDKHILLYQNGIKIRHFNEYSEKIETNENDYILTFYRADHVNKKIEILEKNICEGNGYSRKDFLIVCENSFVDYVENNFMQPDK
jgi:hypothetical protein